MKPRSLIFFAVLIALLAVAYGVQAREAEPTHTANPNLTRKIVSPIQAVEAPQAAPGDDGQGAQVEQTATPQPTVESCGEGSAWNRPSCIPPAPTTQPGYQPTPEPDPELPPPGMGYPHP